jgi:hypothetical protein
MKPVLAIFRKDVRRLWPQIALFAALLLLGALLDPAYTSHRLSTAESWIWFVLPLACLYLVITAIHQECLPGDRQYWLTRPFSWSTLLAAKALFIAAFVNLPVFVCHVIVLASVGIPPTQHFSTLIWRQAFLSAALVLPAAVLASITRSLKQVILAILIIAAPLPLLAMAPGVIGKGRYLSVLLTRIATGDFWLRNLFVAVCAVLGSLLILLFQYRRRATVLARAGFAVVLVVSVAAGSLATPERALAMRAFLSPVRIPASAVRVTGADGAASASLRNNGRRGWLVRLEIPVRVEDLPRDAQWISIGLSGRLQGVPVQGDLTGSSAHSLLAISVDRDVFDRVKASPVDFRGAVDLVLFERQFAVAAPKTQMVAVPGIGACSTNFDPDGKLPITCYSPFARVSLGVEFPGGGRQWIASRRSLEAPMPTAVGFEPLERYSSATPFDSWHEVESLHLFTEKPIATIRREFTLDGIRLPRFASQ